MGDPIDIEKIEAQAFGLAEDHKDLDSPWHSHGHHQILYAAQGSLQLFVPDGQWLLPPQQAAWISAGIRHRVRSRGAQLRTVYLSPFMTPMPRRDTVVFGVTPLATEMLLAAMEWGPTHDTADLLAGHLFGALALYCHRWAEDARPYHLPRAQSPELERAMAYTLAHLSASPNLTDAAQGVALSPRTLARRFESEARTTFRAYLRSARLMRAMELLSTPGARVTEIANQVGFESFAAFTRAFSEFTGELPKDYRQRVNS